MPVSADALRLHLDYSTWASRRLVDAAASLNADEQTRDFKTSDNSVLGTLAHVFAGDRVWLSRVKGETPGPFITPEDRRLEVLQNDWPPLHQRWKQFVGSLSDQDLLSVISYKDTKGNPYQTPLWQILLHLVNHGTHHRGQVSGFLRALGHTPPAVDLIAYYRSL